jgi:catechol 2,3-dioxygenase-like lactoylglutathione lyase family enzyme
MVMGRLQTRRPEDRMMKPRINILTLGVRGLERSLAFYRDGLGLPTQGIVGQEFKGGAVVFFHLEGGLTLALYPTEFLSKDAQVPATQTKLGAISIGHLVGSKLEVDEVLRRAERSGGVITDPAHDRFWGGYSGYFHDPDGHLWEVAWHPEWSRNLPDEV